MIEKPTYEALTRRVKELEEATSRHYLFTKEQMMVAEVLQLINDSKSLKELLGGVLYRLNDWSDCEAVGIRIKEGPDFPYFVTLGFPEQFVEMERYLCTYDRQGKVKRDKDGHPMLECMCGNIVSGRFDPSLNFFTADGSFFSNCTTRLLATTSESDRQARTRNRCNSSGYESVALIPLRSAGETFGLIQLNDHREGMFTPELIGMYRRVADHIAAFLAKRQALEALQKSESRLRTLIDTLPDLVWMKDAKGVYLACNSKFERFFGAKEAEIVGHTDYDFVSRPLADFFREKDQAAMAAGRPCLNEEEVTFADDGHREVLETIKTPVLDAENRITGILGIARDITSRKRAETLLKESEEQLRLFIRHTPAAVAMFDRHMCYVAASSRWISDNRLGGRDILGRSHYEIFPEIPDHWKEAYRNGMQGEVSGVDEECFARLDGTDQWLKWEVRPWYTADNSVGGIVVLTEDITRRKEFETERDKMRTHLIQSQKMESIGRLAGGVAHDLNNLLSPILGYSEMMLDELDQNDDPWEYTNEILHAGMRARDLVRQLLAFSRKQTLEFNRVDINDIIEAFRKLLQRTIPEDIQIKFTLADSPLPVMADVGQIEQVIMNLAVNAADAMPDGGLISIETSRVDLDDTYAQAHVNVTPGRYAMLSISDAGLGMDKETQDHIFDPFFSTKGEHGTGLGLATVYGIVRQHGGNVWVYSEIGKGSSFKVYLPLAQETAIREKETRKPGPDLKGSETVLLVEDSDPVRHLTDSILSRQGYQVLIAQSGEEATDMLALINTPVHLLLTDVVLPGINGRQLYDQIIAQHPDLKVLYMSGYTNNIIAHRGVLEDGLHFIQKPFSARALITKIREVLDED